MVAIVLVMPEIPPNTGNVIRLAANTGAELHLVEPLGFRLQDRELKRAGLDYHEYARVVVHASWSACRQAIGAEAGAAHDGTPRTRRWFALTTRGTRGLFECSLGEHDVFVFGSETAGLSPEVLSDFAPEMRVRLPMRPQVRSLNLSNAVAVTIYEAKRQGGFRGLG